MSQIKNLILHFNDGELYSLPADIVATEYANYYDDSEHVDGWSNLYDECITDSSILRDWFQNDMNWDDYKQNMTLVARVAVAKEIVYIDFE